MKTQASVLPVERDLPRREDSARQVRRDLRFLKLYAYTVPRTLHYSKPPADAGGDAVTPAESLCRIEDGLAEEGTRYRLCAWAIVALLVALPALAAFLWSAMYWLPIRVYWWPFERGNYGLPFLSLFEWLAYLILAAYFVVTLATLREGYAQTHRLAAEYRRLISADPQWTAETVALVRGGEWPRTAFLLHRAPAFAEYRAALDAGGGA